jgi:ATP-dependent RNA helicase DDX35
VHYLLEQCSDYVKAAVNTVVELHREDVPGDVLVFLTGQVGRVLQAAFNIVP